MASKAALLGTLLLASKRQIGHVLGISSAVQSTVVIKAARPGVRHLQRAGLSLEIFHADSRFAYVFYTLT